MADHSLRARTLIRRGDPRIQQTVDATPADQRPTSPDEAYWQAALTVAEADAAHETARRYQPRTRAGCGPAAALLLALAVLVWMLI